MPALAADIGYMGLILVFVANLPLWLLIRTEDDPVKKGHIVSLVLGILGFGLVLVSSGYLVWIRFHS